MRASLILLVSITMVSFASSDDPPLPLPSGTYTFKHRDAEYGERMDFPVEVTIRGAEYAMSVRNPKHPTKTCELESGKFMWNDVISRWVLGTSKSDRHATEAGGCQGNGPDVVDFEKRILFTCVGGSVVTEACAQAEAPSPPPEAQAVIRAVRVAAQKRDYSSLHGLMLKTFVWSFGGDADAERAIAEWRNNPTKYLDAMVQTLRSDCAIDTRTPGGTEVRCPRKDTVSFRAGFTNRSGAWMMRYFVAGD